MRIFCDTNIIVEWVTQRQFSKPIAQILATHETGNTFFISSGSFYTIAYIIDRYLKQKGLQDPERTDEARKILKSLLTVLEIADMHKPSFLSSLDNVRITDLEDGFQYACAQSCGADLLLTINIKDFKEMEHQALPIMTPMEFLVSQL